MIVYRITKDKYAADFSGKGAELFGGRWNKVGTPALYTSENRALCALELLVHIKKELLPTSYVILAITIPRKLEKEIVKINERELEKGWDNLQVENFTQELGEKYFTKKNKLGILIPSVIIQSEYNIVLNSNHKNYKSIKVKEKIKFILDKRLL